MLENIKKVIKSEIWVAGIIIGIVIIAIPSYLFFESELIIWNFWYNYYLLEIILTILIAILFWFFIGSTFYKMKFFSKKNSWLWFFAWFLWILVSWCPACSITFASYLWLSWVIAVLPFWGIELKIISILILLYVIFLTIKNLEICKVKKIKKIK